MQPVPGPTSRRAACRSWPAPCPNRDPASAHRLSRKAIPFDLLIQVGSRHVERARRLRHIPIEDTQLRQKEGSLRRMLELLESLAVEQRAEPALLRIAAADEPRDVVTRD